MDTMKSYEMETIESAGIGFEWQLRGHFVLYDVQMA